MTDESENVRPFKPKRRFELVPFGEIAVKSERSYLVKGLVPREGLAVIWGPPKCGKSFWTFDLVMHVALGWEYRGRRVDPGTVVYIACEGERGLAARVEAFRVEKMAEDSDASFYLLATRLDLSAECEALITDISAQLGGERCVAIVLDTLNRSIGGSESDDRDMGDYVKAADAIRQAFGCAVLIIHHCGVDGTRPRGHTSLTGAADAQLAVKRDAAGQIFVTVEWMKDGVEGDEIVSVLKVVDVGTDADGDAITSCAVVPSDAPASTKAKQPKLTSAAKIALDLLRKAVDEAGHLPPACNHIPAERRVVHEDLWRRYCYEGMISDSDKQDARQKAFKRASEQLQAARLVGVWDGLVWPT